MDMGPDVTVLPRKTKIDHVCLVVMKIGTDHKIGRFDVAVNEVRRVDTLYERKLYN